MSRIGQEVMARLKKNQYTARQDERRDFLEAYPDKAQDIIKRSLVRYLGQGISDKAVVTEVNGNPMQDSKTYEARVVILSYRRCSRHFRYYNALRNGGEVQWKS